jgi:hypothetical protein
VKRRERLFTCTDGKEKLAARRLLEVMLDIELDRPEDEMDTEFIEQCLDALLKMDSSEPHLSAPCRSSMKQAR